MKAAELSALTRRFRTLSSTQLEEGQAMDAVAAQATVANLAPVTPVVSEVTESPALPAPERVS
jgi:hypothetical protein